MARILVADDEGNQRLALGILLRGEGHEVLEASDGAEAIRIIRDAVSDRISVVITDYNMPGASGAQVAEEAARAGIEFIIINSCNPKGITAIDGVTISEKMTPVSVERLVLAPLRQKA